MATSTGDGLADATGVAEHGASAPGMPQLNFDHWGNQIFWLIIALAAIYFILSRVALPRIGAVLAERAGTITNDIAAAEDLKQKARDAEAAYDKALEQFDVLAMPTTPMKAHRHEPGLDTEGIIAQGWDMLDNTAPFDMTGHPAISIPCAKSGGLPVGLMLVGRHFDDATLLRAAHAYERSTPWHERRPGV